MDNVKIRRPREILYDYMSLTQLVVHENKDESCGSDKELGKSKTEREHVVHVMSGVLKVLDVGNDV